MKTMLMALSMLGAMTSMSFAGEVTVTWQDPANFTDLHPSNEGNWAFKERTINQLNRIFADLARELPDRYNWSVTITDVDLAGDIRPLFRHWPNEIRVVKASDWPRIAFRYDLKDSQGRTVASANEDLSDMGFLMHAGGNSTGQTSLRYEERMLRDWFHLQITQKTFPAR